MNLYIHILLFLQIVSFQICYSAQQIHHEENDIFNRNKNSLDIDNFPFITENCDFLKLDKQTFQTLADEIYDDYSKQNNDDLIDIDTFVFKAEQIIVNEFLNNLFYRHEFCADLHSRIHNKQYIEKSNNRIARYLFDHKDNLALKPVLISYINSPGHTFLIDAVKRQKPMFRFAHYEGFHYASKTLLDNVKFLIACGINVNQTDVQATRYERRPSRGTALHYAALNSAIKVVDLLTKSQANLYAETRDHLSSHWTCYADLAIDYAVHDFGTFSLLLDAPGYDINKPNSLGLSLIQRLLYHDASPILFGELSSSALLLKLMIAKGVDLTVKSSSGKTILDIATSQSDYKSVEILLPHLNQDVLAESRPLHKHRATGEAYLKIAALCLDTGEFDVNFQDEEGNTTLHCLAQCGGFESYRFSIWRSYKFKYSSEWKRLEFLLNKGANVNLVNNNGDTVLHSHVKKAFFQYTTSSSFEHARDTKIVSLLLAAGVNTALRNNENKLAVEYVHKGFVDLVRLLTPLVNEMNTN